MIVRRAKFLDEVDRDVPQTPFVYAFSEENGRQRLTINKARAGIIPKSIDETGPEITRTVYEKLPPQNLHESNNDFRWRKGRLALSHDGNRPYGFSTETGASIPLELDVNLIVPEPMVTADLGLIVHGQRCHAFDGARLKWATLTLPPGEPLNPEIRGTTISVHSPTRGDLVFKEGWGKWFTSEEVQAGKVAEHLAQASSKSLASPSPVLQARSGSTPFEMHPSVVANRLRNLCPTQRHDQWHGIECLPEPSHQKRWSDHCSHMQPYLPNHDRSVQD